MSIQGHPFSAWCKSLLSIHITSNTLMIPPLETVRDYGYILGDKALLRLKRCDGNRFRIPVKLNALELGAWFKVFE
ncbi:MAG: hypothetical protein QXU28_06785 [Nitrososphaerota archaeon]